jgi:hypothetical protein
MPPLGVCQIGYIIIEGDIKYPLWLDEWKKWMLRFVSYRYNVLPIARITRAVRLEADGGTENHAVVNLVYETWDDLVADLKQFSELKLVELFGAEKVLRSRSRERAKILARVVLDTQQVPDELRARIVSKILG